MSTPGLKRSYAMILTVELQPGPREACRYALAAATHQVESNVRLASVASADHRIPRKRAHGQEATCIFPLPHRIHTRRPGWKVENGDPQLPEGASVSVRGTAEACSPFERQGAERTLPRLD